MSFADFRGSNQAVSLLQRSLACGRLAHAYLLTGSDRAELEDLARTLAKVVNCQAARKDGGTTEQLDSCDACAACRRIDEYEHSDVHWVRPESKLRVITVEQTRSLMRTVHLKPAEGLHKVAVITAAERMNPQAANAFLKTLEEPPGKSVLVLISMEPDRLLNTIRSRCLRLNCGGDYGPKISPSQVAWLSAFVERAQAEAGGLLGRYRLLGVLLARLGELKAETERELTERSQIGRYADAEPNLRDRLEEELAASVEAEYRRQRLWRAGVTS